MCGAIAATLQVGPNKPYRVPSAAIKAAGEGDTILIDPGLYEKDVVAWYTNNLKIIGVLGPNGERPHLSARGASAQGKAIW